MKNYVSPGETVTVAAPYDVASGAGALVGSLFGVANRAAVSGALVGLDVIGVFDLAKNPAEAWTVGARVYWDNTNRRVTTTATSNTLIGVAIVAAANPSSVGRVRLNASF